MQHKPLPPGPGARYVKKMQICTVLLLQLVGWGIVKIGHKNEAETRLQTRTAMHCMVSQAVELSQHPLPIGLVFTSQRLQSTALFFYNEKYVS